MANFDEAFVLTMKSEGGYANNPNDTGGETYKGVSRKNHPKWNGWKVIDRVKATRPPSLNKALAQESELQRSIRQFYLTEFWDVNQTGKINNQQLACQVFDTAVLSGTGTAAKLLQKAAGVNVDLEVGPKTIAAVNTADAKTIYEKYIELRKEYFLNIIARKPSQKEFLASWVSRLPIYSTETKLA